MSAPPVSVVVASRHRPDLLRRCLTALGQLDYPVFELVVVACPSGVAVADRMHLPCDLTVLHFDEANISKARNIGIAGSRGELIAFIDDDAVPEPTWLHHLVAAFEDPRVAQAGGTTLGRNGISVQHAAARVDACGTTHPVALSGNAPTPLRPENDAVPRLHGTNMAIRREALMRQGGFDERFRFYLDETDLTRRIALTGDTAFVPLAVVHHASGPSTTRGPDRTPRSLFEIGASSAVFHAKHTPQGMREAAKRALFIERRTWLLRHMQAGTLTPDDVARLLRELKRGYEAGAQRDETGDTPPDGNRSGTIPEVDTHGATDTCLVATPWNRKGIYHTARQEAEAGNRVTVFDYSASARFHRVTYTDAGYWLHVGGIYGRELRSEPLIRLATRQQRISSTLTRLARIRFPGGPTLKK